MKQLTILLLLLITYSCKPPITEGIIIDKYYEPNHTYITVLPIVTTNGKTTSTIMIPYVIYDNEDYCVKVRGINIDNDTIINTLYLSKSQYDTLNINEFICIDGHCTDDNNVEKEQ
jgi:hypothetical protein